ncbi:DsbA family oxidoreductase [Mesoplasma lactucae]|uniref:Uncharacterized protein n=1 Tax=Mesoplasma lactucae ATCC 49193 TaxID=81460 RepID=A0A291ISX1_9MOLU|nr:DsbA family protein [Mesoplasma lactucae]ATG97787.1 hypothetical protein CP520_03560 [Mesoplasma lactucae ATCC 49193]ATZ20435.1 disulfide bond formation protein DsbA [Mesoplasma lactucae ATCC 49193]MCL8216607.1 hypothetical protein [Mesoplasma lactucae ATCC 49193]
MPKQTIYMWIDFTSPYSYLAFTNLRKAISDLKRKDFRIDPKTFQVYPDFNPEKPEQTKAFKKISTEEKKVFDSSTVHKMVKQAGLRYEFKNIIPLNTIHPHKLLQLAKTYDDNYEVAIDLVKLLFLNYWSKGKDISNPDELLKISKAAGMTGNDTSQVFEASKYLEMVFLDEQEGLDHDIEGVPFIIFPNGEMVSGVASIDQFKKIIKEIPVLVEPEIEIIEE